MFNNDLVMHIQAKTNDRKVRAPQYKLKRFVTMTTYWVPDLSNIKGFSGHLWHSILIFANKALYKGRRELQSEWSRFEPWLGTWCCVLRQDTLLPQYL